MFDKILEFDSKSDDKNLGEYIQEIAFEEARKLKHEREHQDDAQILNS